MITSLQISAPDPPSGSRDRSSPPLQSLPVARALANVPPPNPVPNAPRARAKDRAEGRSSVVEARAAAPSLGARGVVQRLHSRPVHGAAELRITQGGLGVGLGGGLLATTRELG